ncbi:cytochrome-c oxidase, cbb3-type subunit III [Simonsiella muelleri]|uniref:Cytochrome c oxidase subunit III n=1 Tax=Simonsiella muelleri ATCC 29453 TaxID=641147 RepID=V9H6D3_9NEIS|nr:cytochrome-c oxidase, cbb3-type subunit III [Simonsiella muelleri]AUX60813.1 cytochrome-c oxidase, cbb3-type subunit III [Simonsiella muelleri ATCC 29453]EFG31610.1 cytochrome c oxidase, cbb3-type, subunit III [Simonsiella muelleri ATCC 29453]UBQ54363.1 cytochrome-c oxidase, cbb3-type subunit III [Simonsiella muelleri]
MEQSQFTSPFWHYYIVIIVVCSILWVSYLLWSQNVVKHKKDEDVKTTGHSWDGIEEYNNPLPRWWFYMFWMTIAFAIGYLALYPGLGDFKGIGFNGKPWTSHNQYEAEMEKGNADFHQNYGKFATMSVEEVAKDPNAMAVGANLFGIYCIQCHGSDAQGAKGFPNLTDKDWLWGGTPEKIKETITDGRVATMAPWGVALGGEERVKDVANYVMSLSKMQHNEERAARGQEIFKANCVVCHGDKGQGNMATAPNLTDNIWLWGGTEKAIIETITGGRHGQMPAWKGFLTDDKIHLLTAYVWGKSHPDYKGYPQDTKDYVGGIPTAEEPKKAAEPAASAPVVAVSAPAVAASEPTPVVAASEVQAAPAADKAEVRVENGVVKFYFAVGKSAIAANAEKATGEVVKAAKAGKKLVISGFTDSTGNAVANEKLSKNRAQAVQAYLIKQGVKKDSMVLRKPESSVGAKGNNAEGRRVEVKIQD